MNSTPRTRSALAGVACAALLAAGSGALAQEGGMSVDPRRFQASEDVRPPDPGDPAPANTIVIYAAVLALGVVALGLCLLPSRRGHQD